MATYTEIGDTMMGDRLIAEARNISNVTVIVKSCRHKAQRIKLKDNAMCIIDKKVHFIKE